MTFRTDRVFARRSKANSVAGRSTDAYLSFDVQFDPMQRFRGVHEAVAIDRSDQPRFGHRTDADLLMYVPNLRGLSLRAARSKLRSANCRLGRVTTPPRSVLRLPINRGEPLRVQRQNPRAGRLLPHRDYVGVALVPRRDLKLG